MTTRHDPGPGLLDVAGAAAYTSTSVSFMRRLVRERRIPFHKIGRHVRFAPDDLAEFIEAGRVPTAEKPAGGRS